MRLQSLGVTFPHSDHVGDYPAVFAMWIFENFSRARPWQASPCVRAGILTRGVINITGGGVDDVSAPDSRTTAQFRGPRRGIGNRLIAEFMLARLKDKENVASGGSRSGAINAASPAAPEGTPGGGAPAALPGRAALKKLAGIGGVGPKRPPDKLSQPVILVLKKSVRTRRLDVMPPWECPTSENAADVLLADLIVDQIHDVLKILVVHRHHTRVACSGWRAPADISSHSP